MASARKTFPNATQLLNAGSKHWRRILCPMKVPLTDMPAKTCVRFDP